LVLLLPGFLFSVGLFVPERFTRETAQRSPLGQLAGVLLVALFIHAALFLLNHAVCGAHIPCVDLKRVIDAVVADKASGNASSEIAANLTAFRWSVSSYLLVACAGGVATGWLVGTQTVAGKLSALARHTWIYDLKTGEENSVTVAYVMTHVTHQERVLMYRGFLKAFGLQQDGRFSYLVLTEAVRYYMHLDPARPRTTRKNLWLQIGERSGSITLSDLHEASRDASYFVIEGEDIANAVFDRFTLSDDRIDLAELFEAAESRYEAVEDPGAESAVNSPAADTEDVQ
jgi:hypothetical protein